MKLSAITTTFTKYPRINIILNNAKPINMNTKKMINALKICSLAAFLFLAFGADAQAQKKEERASPPKTSSATVMGGEVTVAYSSPAKKDRVIFGELVPYGKVWRTGANEATTITLESDMKIGGQLVEAGKYALFTVPGESSWEIILNKVWDQWGAYNYEAEQDVVRFSATPVELKTPVENFTIEVDESGKVEMKWDTTAVSFMVG